MKGVIFIQCLKFKSFQIEKLICIFNAYELFNLKALKLKKKKKKKTNP